MRTTRKHFFIMLLFIAIIAVCATGFTLHHFAEEGQNDYISAKTIFTDKLQDNSTELNFWLGDRCYTSTDKEIIKSRRRMGAVVETPSIYLDMSAEDNLKQQYRIIGLPSYDGLNDILKLVGLENTGKKKAKNFSLGMRQRLGIAVALVGDPDFVVLDEPANGLDPQGIIEIRELILELNRKHQITVLISSHMLDELSRLATHYGFIDGGRMVKEISAQELEAACRKCVRLEVSNVKALARVLDGMNVDYNIISDTMADVYAKINVSKFTMLLSKENCEVISIQEKDESLESYYVGLVGGKDNE